MSLERPTERSVLTPLLCGVIALALVTYLLRDFPLVMIAFPNLRRMWRVLAGICITSLAAWFYAIGWLVLTAWRHAP